ncbi:unnamed protein product [Arabidopsis arenosa]|uniref:Uncharacterized protein n=1 Tax=Arabidopsis arenosa TaxID=38785 RepID=A0A8S2A0V4_ARAAE|nr:unnamed protein product [Arabidopsis arenosa]
MTREKRVANRKPKRKKPEASTKESGVDPIRDEDEIVSGDDCEVVGDEDCDGIEYADEEENNEEVREDEEEVREEEHQNRVGVDEELCEERDFEAHFGAAARDEETLKTTL